MKERTTESGRLTLLDRVGSAPFSRTRRILVIGILLLGALAGLLALYLQWVIKATNPVDLTFLPLMAVLFLGMAALLAYRRDKLNLVENAAYLMLVLYGLSMLVYQVRFTLPELHTFTETMFWFPMLYLVAYLLHRRAMAFRVAATIWVVALLLGLASAPLGDFLRTRDAAAINALLQFYISGIVYILLLYSFSRIEENYAETRMLAYLDHLTQLPNRRYGEAVLVQLLRQVREQGGRFSVVMLDLDGFKKVNDRHGHDVGDRVLKRSALLIQRHLPRGARVIRWGGEEFLIVLPGLEERGAQAVAEEVRRGLETSPHEGVGPVLASFGVASYRINDSLDALIQRADRAMYFAKQSGGNRVVAFSEMLQAVQA